MKTLFVCLRLLVREVFVSMRFVNSKSKAGLIVMVCTSILFRDFITEFMETGFHQFYGLFTSTSQQLYPNPDAVCTQPDYLEKIHLLGKVLAKIIYEGMKMHLILADFFLCKLLDKNQRNTSMCFLESLDPDMYEY